MRPEDKIWLNSQIKNMVNKKYTQEMTPAERVKGGASALPVIGDAISGYDAYQSAKQGDYLGAALNAVGLLPMIPGLAGTIKNIDTPDDFFKRVKLRSMLESAPKVKPTESNVDIAPVNKFRIDVDGKPRIYNHSTKNDFSDFRESSGGTYLSSGGGSSAYDIFDGGDGYTKNLHIVSENPFNANPKTMSEKEKTTLKEVMDQLFDINDLNDLRNIDSMNSGRASNIDHFELFTDGDFYLTLGRNAQDKVMNALKLRGYDSVEFPDSLSWGDGNMSTVVFDPKKIFEAK